MKKEVRLGKIVRAFGIKGEVKIALTTDIPAKRFKGGNIIIATHPQFQSELVVESFRMHQNHALVKFETLDSIDDVSKLVQATLSTIVETDHEDRVAFFDLVGCDVMEQKINIGKVVEVLDYPAHAVLRVVNQEKNVLIPYVDAFIVNVDTKNRIIEIQSIEGLL